MLKNKSSLIFLLCFSFVAMAILTYSSGAIIALVTAKDTSKEIVPQPIPKISEDLRNQLNTAFNPSLDFNFAQNPFQHVNFKELKDVGSKTVFGKPESAPLIARSNIGDPNTLPQFPQNPLSQNQAGGKKMVENESVLKVAESFDKEAFERERNSRLRSGKTLADLISISDLKPFGTVGSGNRNFIKLFSIKTGDRITVPLGTRFRDGFLESVNDEGVSFNRDGQTVFVRWARSSNSKSAK